MGNLPVKKKVLKKVPKDKCFYTINGGECRDLLSLADKIDEMEDHQFKHHVDDSKNDFASWIEDVFHEPKLATKIRNAKSKEEHVILLLRYVLRTM